MGMLGPYPNLVDQVCDYPLPDTSGPEFDIKTSKKEQELASRSTLSSRVQYAHTFKNHHNMLCNLSNTLDTLNDYYGVESEEAKVIGREAFLQVDHPYYIRGNSDFVRDTLSNRNYPHWLGKKSGNIYKSTKALGVIWDYVEEKIRSVQRHNQENFSDKSEANSFIMNHIRKIEIKAGTDKTAEDYLMKLRSKMRSAAVQYNSELNKYLDENSSRRDEDNAEFRKCLRKNCCMRDEVDKDTWDWMKSSHEFWRKKLFKSIDYDNINLAAAIL